MKQTRNLEDLLRQYDLLAAPAAPGRGRHRYL